MFGHNKKVVANSTHRELILHNTLHELTFPFHCQLGKFEAASGMVVLITIVTEYLHCLLEIRLYSLQVFSQ